MKLYNPEEIDINTFYTEFLDFKLIGFIDVTEMSRNHKNGIYEYKNQFALISTNAILKENKKEIFVIPTFFGRRNDFLFDNEFINIKYGLEEIANKINLIRPYVIFYKGNDDISLGKRFKTEKERLTFFNTYSEKAGCLRRLKYWN